MTNCFEYEGTRLDESIKYTIEKVLEEYKKALEALKSLEDFGIQLPIDSIEHLRLSFAGPYLSYKQKHVWCYIYNRMCSIERKLGIHSKS